MSRGTYAQKLRVLRFRAWLRFIVGDDIQNPRKVQGKMVYDFLRNDHRHLVRTN